MHYTLAQAPRTGEGDRTVNELSAYLSGPYREGRAASEAGVSFNRNPYVSRGSLVTLKGALRGSVGRWMAGRARQNTWRMRNDDP
jgi:hypothetical protein